MSWRTVRFLSLIFLCAVTAAQTPSQSPNSYKLHSIHVKGLSRLTENQVVGASGLKLGQMAGEPEFQQAAQKLGSTGLFTDLTYSYQYSGGESDLEFQVKENEKLLPIIFENFVWFSDEDLLTQLRARIPLFNGRVPAEGDLTEAVASALVAILHEHKIAGEVQYLAFAQENGPVQAYEYKVSFHSIVIRNVDFPGAAQDELPALQAAAKSLAGSDYLRTHMQAQEHFNFLPVYEARGYLKAKFADSQARIVEDGGQTIVDVSCPVTRGGLYKLKSLEFDGDKAVSAEQLRNLVHLKFGDPANAVELADDVEQMQKLYGTKGYLSAAIDPEADMDEASGTVTYRMLVTEGELYRMGDLNIDGLPEANATRMAAQWQMKKGDPFDNTYLQKFFSILYRDFDLQRSYAVSSKQAINEQNKSVSVSLHFVAKS